MNPKLVSNKKGVTLIELLVGLVIFAIIIAGIYRVFITQTRTYAFQDQVVEVQQDVRSAMELMLRDIRMAGYKSNINPVTLPTPVFPGDYVKTVKTDAIRIEYQKGDKRNAVVYYTSVAPDGTQTLNRALYIDDVQVANSPEPLLDNVTALNFAYGVDGIVGFDASQDGGMDDRNGDGIINDSDWVIAPTVNAGNLNIIAIQVTLGAKPSNPAGNPDIKNISARNLVSTVNLRNLCLIKSN